MGLYIGLLILTIALLGGVVFGRLLLAFLRAARDGATRPEDVLQSHVAPAPVATPDAAAPPRLAVVAALAAPRKRRKPPTETSAPQALDGEILPPRHADPLAASAPWHNGRGIFVQERV